MVLANRRLRLHRCSVSGSLFLAVSLSAFSLLTGCGGGSGTPNGQQSSNLLERSADTSLPDGNRRAEGQTGRLGLFVTATPGANPRADIEHLWVNLRKVELIDVQEKAVTIFEEAEGTPLDLMTLHESSGRRFALLTAAAVPSGKSYLRVRLTFDKAFQQFAPNAVVAETVPLSDTLARDEQENPVLSFPLTRPRDLGNGRENLVVDFDLAKMVRQDNRWIPALREGEQDGLNDLARQIPTTFSGTVRELTNGDDAESMIFTLERASENTSAASSGKAIEQEKRSATPAALVPKPSPPPLPNAKPSSDVTPEPPTATEADTPAKTETEPQTGATESSEAQPPKGDTPEPEAGDIRTEAKTEVAPATETQPNAETGTEAKSETPPLPKVPKETKPESPATNEKSPSSGNFSGLAPEAERPSPTPPRPRIGTTSGLMVQTNEATVFENSGPTPNPTLTEGKRVLVRGVLDPTTRRVVAQRIIVQGATSARAETAVLRGWVLSANGTSGTVTLNTIQVSGGLLPTFAAVTAQLTADATLRSRGGLLLTNEQFYETLKATPGSLIALEGRYEPVTGTLRATVARLEESVPTATHEAEIEGTAQEADPSAGTFTLTAPTYWQGIAADRKPKGILVTLTPATAFQDEEGQFIASTTFWNAVKSGEKAARAIGLYTNRTLTATRLILRTQAPLPSPSERRDPDTRRAQQM